LQKTSRELRESTRISFVRVLPGSRLFFTVCDQRGRKQKKDRKQKNSRQSQIQQEIVFQFVFIREIRG
jgi:hypothetical protein